MNKTLKERPVETPGVFLLFYSNIAVKQKVHT